jgi:predicted kinase
VASYTAAADDPLVPVLLPFYACYRACVRAKVEGLVLAEVDAQDPAYHQAATRARAHYALAVRYAWRAYGPAIVACVGLSGTGKSTLADILAEATGYERISSDAIRKRPALFPPDPALHPAAPGSGLYELGQRMATYGALCQQVEEAVAAHHGVIADATFIKWSNRLKIAAIARRHQCPHVFVECRADEATVRVRLLERDRSPTDSDARWETYCAQRDEQDPFGAGESHLSVDTTGDLSTLRATALRRLWQWRKDNGRSGRAGERSQPSTERAVRESA